MELRVVPSQKIAAVDHRYYVHDTIDIVTVIVLATSLLIMHMPIPHFLDFSFVFLPHAHQQHLQHPLVVSPTYFHIHCGTHTLFCSIGSAVHLSDILYGAGVSLHYLSGRPIVDDFVKEYTDVVQEGDTGDGGAVDIAVGKLGVGLADKKLTMRYAVLDYVSKPL